MGQYHELLSPENEIIFSASYANSFQEIIEPALRLMPASIVVADSLHYVLAMSEDLSARFPGEVSWLDLIESGYVPPVAEQIPEMNDADRPKPNTELLDRTLSVHSDITTLNGCKCTMFDILNEDTTVLKLAITSKETLTVPQKKIALALATALHMAYFRLGTGSENGSRGRYLVALLQESAAAEDDLSELNSFDAQGPFCLVCFEIRQLGIHNLSFISAFADLSRQPNVLTTRYGETFVMLLNTHQDMKPLLTRLDQFAKEHHFPILLSRSYQDLHKTAQYYQEISTIAILATHFQGACGIQRWTEYTLFLAFEQLKEKRIDSTFYHRDASILIEYDEKKNTQYAQTVYCYLLHNREAPATADALFIHRNTLDKRLRKIEGLITADWRDVTYQFRMLYSLFVELDSRGQLSFYSKLV